MVTPKISCVSLSRFVSIVFFFHLELLVWIAYFIACLLVLSFLLPFVSIRNIHFCSFTHCLSATVAFMLLLLLASHQPVCMWTHCSPLFPSNSPLPRKNQILPFLSHVCCWVLPLILPAGAPVASTTVAFFFGPIGNLLAAPPMHSMCFLPLSLDFFLVFRMIGLAGGMIQSKLKQGYRRHCGDARQNILLITPF